MDSTGEGKTELGAFWNVFNQLYIVYISMGFKDPTSCEETLTTRHTESLCPGLV